MRRITVWLTTTIAAVVLLFSYRTSTHSGVPPTAGNDPGATANDDPGGAAGADPGATAGSTPSTPGGKTYPGSVAQTRWGPVQVTITVVGKKITRVSVPTYPTGNRKDREINAYALPILRRATVAAQSANVDTVSGATVTSDGYRESLQAAIDAAHLA